MQSCQNCYLRDQSKIIGFFWKSYKLRISRNMSVNFSDVSQSFRFFGAWIFCSVVWTAFLCPMEKNFRFWTCFHCYKDFGLRAKTFPILSIKIFGRFGKIAFFVTWGKCRDVFLRIPPIFNLIGKCAFQNLGNKLLSSFVEAAHYVSRWTLWDVFFFKTLIFSVFALSVEVFCFCHKKIGNFVKTII